jgi:recombination protein RecA
MAKAKKESEDGKDPLQKLKDEMNAKYGKGTVLGGKDKIRDYEVVSTGSIAFDRATNCGGIPIGKLVEIFGLESSGKSTLTLHIIAEYQKAGKICLLADFEHSFDSFYAETIGVNVDDLIISQPPTMEDGYNLIYDYVASGLVDLVVLDSHTSMIAKQRLTGEIGDAKIAPEARLNSDALKVIHPALDKFKCTLIGVSQLRDNIGGMGDTKVPTGGNSWKFYPDMRIKIFKQLDRVNETNETTIEIVKNKCAKPYGKCKIPIAWGIGIDKVQELINEAVDKNIINKAGSWYSYNGDKIGQGNDKVKQLLEDNPELLEEVRVRVLAFDQQIPENLPITNEITIEENAETDQVPVV